MTPVNFSVDQLLVMLIILVWTCIQPINAAVRYIMVIVCILTHFIVFFIINTLLSFIFATIFLIIIAYVIRCVCSQ